MDTQTGQVYESKADGEADLRSKGVSDADIEKRLVAFNLKDVRLTRKQRRKFRRLASEARP